MTYEFEQLGEFTREYTIALDPEAFEAKHQSVTNDAASSVYLKGFRKGKVPRDLIKQRYGKEIEMDVANQLIQESCTAVLNASEIDVLWMSEPWPADGSTDTSRVYKLQVETKPNIDAPNLADLEVTQTKVEVTRDDAYTLFNQQREGGVDWFPLTGDDIKAEYGDRVSFDLLYTEKDESVEADEPEETVFGEYSVILRAEEGRLINPDLNDQIMQLSQLMLGCKVGDRIEVSKDLVAENIAKAKVFDGLNSIPVSITELKTGDLPLACEQLYDVLRVTNLGQTEPTPIERLDTMLEAIQATANEQVTNDVATLNSKNIRRALARAISPTLPGQWLRQAYWNHVDNAQYNDYMAISAKLSFNKNLEELSKNSKPSSLESESKALEESSVAEEESDQSVSESTQYQLDNVQRYFQKDIVDIVEGLTYVLVSESLVKAHKLEPIQEWINDQVRISAESIPSRATSDEEVQQMYDQLYSDEHYQQLVRMSIDKQISEQTLEACRIDEKQMSFAEFNQSMMKDQVDTEVFEFVSVAPNFDERRTSSQTPQVVDEDGDIATEDETSDSASSKIDQVAEGETENLSESGQDEPLESAAKTESEGFLRRIFSKKSS